MRAWRRFGRVGWLAVAVLPGCNLFASWAGDAASPGSAAAILRAGAAGARFNASGVPGFVIPFDRSPIAQPGVLPGGGAP